MLLVLFSFLSSFLLQDTDMHCLVFYKGKKKKNNLSFIYKRKEATFAAPILTNEELIYYAAPSVPKTPRQSVKPNE